MTLAVAHAALDAAGEPALDGIRITNQRETVVAWDRRSSERFTARSCGRTAARPGAATSCRQQATSRSFGSARAWWWTPTSRAPRSSG